MPDHQQAPKPRFTEGPWRIADAFTVAGLTMNDGSVPILGGPADDADRAVCVVSPRAKAKRGQAYRAADPERDANLSLIAAAPEMLEAGAALLTRISEGSDRAPVSATQLRLALAWLNGTPEVAALRAATAKAEGR